MKRSERSDLEMARTAADWISRRDAGLSPGEQAKLEAWIAADARHAAAFGRLDRTWAALGQPRRDGDAAGFEVAMARVSRRRKNARLGVVASLCLAASLALFLASARQRPEPRSTALAIVAQSFTLPDGSTVEYSQNTKFEVNFSAGERRVSVQRGQAVFRVAENAIRPFIVETGNVEFRALGTIFALNLGRRTELIVTEGRVAVEQRSRGESEQAASATMAIVGAGQLLMVETRAAATDPKSISALSGHEISERLAWMKPHVELDETPLEEVVTLINKFSRVQFEIGDPSLRQVPVTGFFRADDSETFQSLLQVGFGVRSDRQGDRVTLVKAR